ncbi:copper transporter 5.1-like [Tasmannia lanceolata]|uniref:copper transporter 5.1-like n=1 Tax=Tasmannia lanceolata TaxID=3420 RepID=UPI004062DF8E
MMHMTFYWGKKVTLLFDSWKTNSWPSYALTLIVVFLFSVFYQYMEDRRLRFKILASIKPSPLINTPLLLPRLYNNKNSAKFSVALLFGVNSAIGYLLMLAVMSFNGGIFIAVILGLTDGYLLFRVSDEEIVAVENPCACA